MSRSAFALAQKHDPARKNMNSRGPMNHVIRPVKIALILSLT